MKVSTMFPESYSSALVRAAGIPEESARIAKIEKVTEKLRRDLPQCFRTETDPILGKVEKCSR